jgi:succinyl-diaminopimelate desuccinylase
MTDLLALTAELVAIPSVSRNEEAIADHIEDQLRAAPWLEIDRLGHNVVARTHLGRSQRLLIGGHLDTVPGKEGQTTRVDGDTLWGLGSADMKGGVAVMLELARTVAEPGIDVTYVFYECEEVDFAKNGLGRLAEQREDLLMADAAILAEPTAARVEAGCQGTMRVRLTFEGTRAHTARAWLGRNAIHKAGAVLRRLAEYEPRRPVIDGCVFHEGLQAVIIEGGVAHNVVPDRATVVVNHRFAPDRMPEEAVEHVRAVVGEVDGFEILELTPGAPPGLGHPLLARLVERGGFVPTAKLGWTDVARFAGRGVPALNFGPGDPLLAHTAEERVERHQLEAAFTALRDLLDRGA